MKPALNRAASRNRNGERLTGSTKLGTYSEALHFPNDGSADGGYITLRNHGAEKVILTGEKLPTELLASVDPGDVRDGVFRHNLIYSNTDPKRGGIGIYTGHRPAGSPKA